ncbi:MAG: Hsp20/alpha crystallin family protein [Pseudomonadota bacterium]
MVETNPTHGFWPDLFQPFRAVGERVADWFSPRSDAADARDAYRIGLELPGVGQDDIDVELHDGVLVVKGEKKLERTEEKDGYFFSERQYGRFQRSFRLPVDAAPEGIAASFKDGVLTVTIPKVKEPEAVPKRIRVSAG